MHSQKIEPFSADIESIMQAKAFMLWICPDVKGQENVKRAMEIAAAGGHNMLMIGPPGSGKHHAGEAFSNDTSRYEQRRKSRSDQNLFRRRLVKTRNAAYNAASFRFPHHTISSIALVGGANTQTGEVSLAHKGVLFLDEFAEFQKMRSKFASAA